MCVYNKVLLSLIALVTIVFFILGANRYQLGKEWEEKIAKQAKQIEDLQNQVTKLHGEIYSDSAAVANDMPWPQRPLKLRLDTVRAHHGGALWAHCTPQTMPQLIDRQVRLSFTLGTSDRPRMFGETLLQQDAKFYVFDSGAAGNAGNESGGAGDEEGDGAEFAGGQQAVFLGTFVCDAGNNAPYDPETKELSVVSIGTFSETEVDSIAASVQAGHEWFVYVGDLPADDPALLAGLLTEPAFADAVAAFPEDLLQYMAKGAGSADDLLSAAAAGDGADDGFADDTDADDESAADESAIVDADDTDDTDDTASVAAGKSNASVEGVRYPRDYAQMLLARSGKRDELNLTVQRYRTALDDLGSVICDQFAIVGLDKLPEDFLEQINSDPEQVAFFNTKFAEAVKRNPATPEMKTQATVLIRLNATQKERDLVKGKVDEAAKIVEQLQARIDTLLVENDALAAKISRALFTSVDSITQEADRVTEASPSLRPSLMPSLTPSPAPSLRSSSDDI